MKEIMIRHRPSHENCLLYSNTCVIHFFSWSFRYRKLICKVVVTGNLILLDCCFFKSQRSVGCPERRFLTGRWVGWASVRWWNRPDNQCQSYFWKPSLKFCKAERKACKMLVKAIFEWKQWKLSLTVIKGLYGPIWKQRDPEIFDDEMTKMESEEINPIYPEENDMLVGGWAATQRSCKELAQCSHHKMGVSSIYTWYIEQHLPKNKQEKII